MTKKPSLNACLTCVDARDMMSGGFGRVSIGAGFYSTRFGYIPSINDRLWGNDMLGTIERGNICRLVEFINDSVLLLKDNPLALGAGDKFQELLEIVSNCPRKWIYFKPFEDIGGIVKPID